MTKNKNNIYLNVSRIYNILKQGYYLVVWPNAYGEDCFWLVEDGKEPSEGIYISHKRI